MENAAPARTLAALVLAALLAMSLLGAPAPLQPPKAPTNSVGMKLVRIAPGKFLMGSLQGEPGRLPSEGPAHEVEITRPFYLGAHEVTQAQYQKVIGSSPSHFAPTGAGKEQVRGLDTADFPVESLTREEAITFCQRLSALPREKMAGRVYRLPSEAEWEYACRAGTTTAFNVGATLAMNQAHFAPRARPEKVGLCKPNAWGLYDMHGNVWEYCADRYDQGYYVKSPKKDPKGPIAGGFVVRGGGWEVAAANCRSARRSYASQSRYQGIGFRVACTISKGR